MLGGRTVQFEASSWSKLCSLLLATLDDDNDGEGCRVVDGIGMDGLSRYFQTNRIK